MVSAGADLNAFAAEYDSAPEMASLHLVVNGAKSRQMRDSMARGQLLIAEVLLSSSADPNAQTVPDGNSPTHLGSPLDLSLLEILERYSADLNARNDHGRTPLAVFRVSYRDNSIEALALPPEQLSHSAFEQASGARRQAGCYRL